MERDGFGFANMHHAEYRRLSVGTNPIVTTKIWATIISYSIELVALYGQNLDEQYTSLTKIMHTYGSPAIFYKNITHNVAEFVTQISFTVFILTQAKFYKDFKISLLPQEILLSNLKSAEQIARWIMTIPKEEYNYILDKITHKNKDWMTIIIWAFNNQT